MKKIAAINGSPRVNWNTGTLVRDAAEGAKSAGAEVQVFDLYRLEKYTGCISCFGCKLAPNTGKCICRDGLAPVLQTIREADGVILGSPNYLSNVSAGFRALYERLIFQSLTYKREPRSYNTHRIPVLFVMTSNAPKAIYDQMGYTDLLQSYQSTLETFVGDTRIYVADNTLQVKDYSRFDWTMFDIADKQARHETVFPQQREELFSLGAQMVNQPW